MNLLLEGIRNKVYYALKDSRKLVGQLDEFYYSIGIQIFLNGSKFKYHFWGGRFHMFPKSYTFYHRLCFNNFLQFWLIGNKRDQVTQLRYINWVNEVSHLGIGSKVLGDMIYLIRPVK